MKRVLAWPLLPWVALVVVLIAVAAGVVRIFRVPQTAALASAEASARAAAKGRKDQEAATDKLRETEDAANTDRERVEREASEKARKAEEKAKERGADVERRAQAAEAAVDTALATSVDALRDLWEKAMGRP